MLARYIAEHERVYPYARRLGGVLPLLAAPGMDPVDLDEIPEDGCWQAVPDAPKKAPAAAKTAEGE